jgi:hypothetical protein
MHYAAAANHVGLAVSVPSPGQLFLWYTPRFQGAYVS